MNRVLPSQIMMDVSIALGLLLALGVVFQFDDPSTTPGPENGSTRQVVNLISPNSIYAERVAPDRKEKAKERGGSTLSEKAVVDGLAWLARHQFKDGSWSNRCLGNSPPACCEANEPCSGTGEYYPMAHTGLALLAFQGAGHFYFNGTEHSDAVRRGLDWLVEHQDKDGGLFHDATHPHFMYQHGIATFALAEACALAIASGEDSHSRYRNAARKAVDYIQTHQHDDGGWRYTPRPSEASDVSVSGWQVLALKTAIEARISVASTTIDKAEQFFKSCEMADNGRTGYVNNRSLHTEATTGVGMLVHQFLLDSPDSPLLEKAAPYLADFAEQHWGARTTSDADYYLWYNCTLAMFQAGGPSWNDWNSIIRDRIIDLQEHEGCARGSWPPDSVWGGGGGRIYTTALAILTLEVYYRFAKK